MPDTRYSIAVLISGSGTTLRNLIEKRDAGELEAEITHVISSKPDAGGLQYCRQADIPHTVVDHKKVTEPEFSQTILETCRAAGVDLIVMGGFLRKLDIAADFENRVINIHPSLIPAFCGRGNYGIRVHRAVVDFGCKLSGCTVHFVDNQYDHGPIIAQRAVPVASDDSPESLAKRIFEEECRVYPHVINQFARGKVTIENRTVCISS